MDNCIIYETAKYIENSERLGRLSVAGSSKAAKCRKRILVSEFLNKKLSKRASIHELRKKNIYRFTKHYSIKEAYSIYVHVDYVPMSNANFVFSSLKPENIWIRHYMQSKIGKINSFRYFCFYILFLH
ncbi:hypothetical protein ENBRE01_0653 [Enteropsectra breve]|nr:hypothetical protein ENBRE01_0653 [Enteropsectra breve]